jgi:glycosyltransferase involved in cell wall biosynthesis
MEVAVVAPLTTNHGATAARERLHRVAAGLLDRGHIVTVYCSRWWDISVPEFSRDGITYRAVTGNYSPLAFALKLPLLLARDRPDVVHAAHVPRTTAFAAALSRITTFSPAIVDWYEDSAHAGRAAVGRTASRVLTPSRMVAADARERGVPDGAIERVPEWIDLSRIRAVDPIDTDLVVSRRLDRAANLDSVLLALGELRTRDWTLTVIGDGPRRDAYEQRARDLRIADRIDFCGALPLDERLARFRGAHAFLHTATRTPFARELCWGLAAGCVGIVQYAERSAAHELVEGRERGFLATEPEGLADRITDAADLAHRDIDESFGEFDRGHVLDQLESVYREAGASG